MNESREPASVLDASALLALIREERGAERVGAAISEGALVSVVNWAEVLANLVVGSDDPHEVTSMALPGGPASRLELVSFDDEQAKETARLVRYTRSLGLSLADRAALALARIRRLPVLTTDRAWRALRLPIKIEVIR
ncbi:MAG: PIN domain-containing protein [Acidobacteria bacterium]|nr:PIN domain-containing protein [Acidobacteriota bacterium]